MNLNQLSDTNNNHGTDVTDVIKTDIFKVSNIFHNTHDNT